VKRGLVRRETDPADRRARRLGLTDDGRAVLATIEPARRAVNVRITEALGHDASAVADALARLAVLGDDDG
jgi:DNA-binding MarR family transcriptional regulator